MDQRKDHFQTLGICYRLHNFIKKVLLTHAYKSVILGDPLNRNSAKTKTKAAKENDQMVHQRTQEQQLCEGAEDQAYNMSNSEPSEELPEVQDTTIDIIGLGKGPDEEAPLISLEAKPPKKTVSINDRVEEIDTRKKKIRRKKSKENLTLIEQEEDEPKPLRSILKVGSYSGEKSYSFVNPTTD